jgi:hypothetical protein
MTPFYGGASGLTSGAMTPNWGTKFEGLESVVGSRASSLAGVRSLISRRKNRDDELADVSCLCVPSHHRLREDAYDVLSHWTFDYFMFFLIFASCVAMALEGPNTDERTHAKLKILDYCLTACFTLECAAKIFAFGFPKYIRERTNQLDFFIVATTLLEIALTSVASHIGWVRSLRVLRAIRPLRALTKSSGMRLVLKSVALSIGAMVNVSVVVLMFFVVFGILGVQVFAGRFYRCNDPDVAHRRECVGEFYDVTSLDVVLREWSNAYLNFDNLYRALISLFVVSTLDGYDRGPRTHWSPYDSVRASKELRFLRTRGYLMRRRSFPTTQNKIRHVTESDHANLTNRIASPAGTAKSCSTRWTSRAWTSNRSRITTRPRFSSSSRSSSCARSRC